jgi:hypothetical protein
MWADPGKVDAKSNPLALTAPATASERHKRDAYLRSHGINPNEAMQLEIWPDDMRAIPNDYARSALFTIRNKSEERAALQGAVLFHMDKAITVVYTGIELRADDDELVWQQILNYAKRQVLGEPVLFGLNQLCRDVGWAKNGRNFDRARACISRLKANEVLVINSNKGMRTAVSLIAKYEVDGDNDKKGSQYRAWIHADLTMLFAGQNYTRLNWDKYRDLTPTARRLYDYFASHKSPFPIALEKFAFLCGSSNTKSRSWAQKVKAACKELIAAGLVKNAWVAKDCIFCER